MLLFLFNCYNNEAQSYAQCIPKEWEDLCGISQTATQNLRFCLDAVFTCGGNYHGQCGIAHLDASSVRELTEVPDISSKIKQVNEFHDIIIIIINNNNGK